MMSQNACFIQGPTLILVTIFSAALPGCHYARYGDSLTIAKTASLSDASGVTPAVRSECRLETKLPEFLAERSKKHFDNVTLADNVGLRSGGRTLSVKILHVLGAGGGVYSGPKSITINGVLRDNGKVVGSFTASEHLFVRPSPGTIYIGGGTCKMLDEVSKKLAVQLMRWMENPTMNAKLGDVK